MPLPLLLLEGRDRQLCRESPTQAETGCRAASRRNERIVELGSLEVGWGTARFGKNSVPDGGYPSYRRDRCKGCPRRIIASW